MPYDTPVIGYGMKTVNTLRLWQAEPFQGIRFQFVQRLQCAAAVRERDAAEDIQPCAIPQRRHRRRHACASAKYFFSSASLQDMVRHRAAHGGFLLPTHTRYSSTIPTPTVAIRAAAPVGEEAGMRFADAVQVAHDTFAYTQPHHCARGAGKKWDQKLFRGVLAPVYPYVKRLDGAAAPHAGAEGPAHGRGSCYAILEDGMVHMARMAIFCHPLHQRCGAPAH